MWNIVSRNYENNHKKKKKSEKSPLKRKQRNIVKIPPFLKKIGGPSKRDVSLSMSIHEQNGRQKWG